MSPVPETVHSLLPESTGSRSPGVAPQGLTQFLRAGPGRVLLAEF